MEDWRSRAACREHDPSLWDVEKLYGPGAQKRMQERTAKAKSICATCPVRDKCAEYGLEVALEFDSIEQIYGGFTPQELADAVGCHAKFVSGVLTFRDEEKELKAAL